MAVRSRVHGLDTAGKPNGSGLRHVDAPAEKAFAMSAEEMHAGHGASHAANTSNEDQDHESEASTDEEHEEDSDDSDDKEDRLDQSDARPSSTVGSREQDGTASAEAIETPAVEAARGGHLARTSSKLAHGRSEKKKKKKRRKRRPEHLPETVQLTGDQIAEFKQAFDLFDKDGDGSIGLEELAAVMRTLDVNDSEVEAFALDKAGNGATALNFAQFCDVMAHTLVMQHSMSREAQAEIAGVLEMLHNFDGDSEKLKVLKMDLASKPPNWVHAFVESSGLRMLVEGVIKSAVGSLDTTKTLAAAVHSTAADGDLSIARDVVGGNKFEVDQYSEAQAESVMWESLTCIVAIMNHSSGVDMFDKLMGIPDGVETISLGLCSASTRTRVTTLKIMTATVVYEDEGFGAVLRAFDMLHERDIAAAAANHDRVLTKRFGRLLRVCTPGCLHSRMPPHLLPPPTHH